MVTAGATLMVIFYDKYFLLLPRHIQSLLNGNKDIRGWDPWCLLLRFLYVPFHCQVLKSVCGYSGRETLVFVRGLRPCGRFFAWAKVLQPHSAEGLFGGSSFCGFEYVQSILVNQFWATCGAGRVPASQLSGPGWRGGGWQSSAYVCLWWGCSRLLAATERVPSWEV